MKLQCTINDHPRDGYEFYDPISNKDFNGNYMEMVHKYNEGDISEIYAPTLLNFINWNSMLNMIKEFNQLIHMEGKLVLGGTDPYIMAKKLISRDLNWEKYNELVFTSVGRKINFVPMPQLKEELAKYYKIQNISVDYKNFNYVITGERLG